MSAQNKARSLMNLHHHNIKHRQQSLLKRTASEIGIDVDGSHLSAIQGKPLANSSNDYGRSRKGLS